MRIAKSLGLLAIAAAAIMAFAANASATRFTTTTGGFAETPTIHAVNSGFHVTLSNPIANISCSSTIEAKVASHGAYTTGAGGVGTLTFTGCTNSWHVTSISNGSLEIHYSAGHNGWVFSSGARIDTTRLGVTCVYETFSTPIGNISGGNPAIINVNALVPLKPFESSSLCGAGSAVWEGQYRTTSALYVAT